jgi:hypothetical protein
MLRYSLTGHVKMFAKLTQRLRVVCIEHIEQFSPTWIGESLKHIVGIGHCQKLP